MKGSQAMAKKRTVLGNDPFQRGAAVRTDAPAGRPAPAKEAAAGPSTPKRRQRKVEPAPASPEASGKEPKSAKETVPPSRRRSAPAKADATKRPRRGKAAEARAEKTTAKTTRRSAAKPASEKATATPQSAARPEQPAAKPASEPPDVEVAQRSAGGPPVPPPATERGGGGLLPSDAGAERRRPAVVAVEPIAAAAPTEPGAPHPTALQALEAAGAALAGVLRLPSAPAATDVDEFGRDLRFEEQVRPLLEWIYRRWFRVEATGFEALPRDVSLILVANRAGALPWDSVILALAARHAGLEVRPLVEDSIFHFPSMGLFVNRLGAVRACPENAERILGSGGAVAVFPEGATGFGKPFRERYRLQRFGRGGFLKLALRMEALVVPVSIVGSEEIYPLLGKVGLRPFGFPFLPITPTFPWLGAAGLLPLPAHWHIDAGEPFDFRGYGTAAAQDEPLVMRLAEEVRGTVQTMLDARLGQRRSVFR